MISLMNSLTSFTATPSLIPLRSPLTGLQTCQAHCYFRAFACAVFSAWYCSPRHLHGSFFHPHFLCSKLSRPSLNIWFSIMTSCPTLMPFPALFFFAALFILHHTINLLFNLIYCPSPSLYCKPYQGRDIVVLCHIFSACTLPGS